jgi:hypothetical protein
MAPEIIGDAAEIIPERCNHTVPDRMGGNVPVDKDKRPALSFIKRDAVDTFVHHNSQR